MDNQQFVENAVRGKWLHKKSISITFKNGVEMANDTIYYGLDSPAVVLPVDTIQFLADGTCIKQGQKLSYSIDKAGDYLQYESSPPDTWKIEYLRFRSIILNQETTETKGTDTYRYYKEDQLTR